MEPRVQAAQAQEKEQRLQLNLGGNSGAAVFKLYGLLSKRIPLPGPLTSPERREKAENHYSKLAGVLSGTKWGSPPEVLAREQVLAEGSSLLFSACPALSNDFCLMVISINFSLPRLPFPQPNFSFSLSVYLYQSILG